MEVINDDGRATYKHTTEYRGEEILVKIVNSRPNRDSSRIVVEVSTPPSNRKFGTRFYKDKMVETIDEAKLVSREMVTEATTNIDKHLSDSDDLETFFDSVDEVVASLEQKLTTIEEEYSRELNEV